MTHVLCNMCKEMLQSGLESEQQDLATVKEELTIAYEEVKACKKVILALDALFPSISFVSNNDLRAACSFSNLETGSSGTGRRSALTQKKQDLRLCFSFSLAFQIDLYVFYLEGG